MAAPSSPVLPAEKVVYDYDDLGRPVRMGGSMGQYVIATAYSAYSQLDQLALGNTYGHMSWQSYRYELGSGRLSEEQVDRQTRPELDQLQTYAYDLAGNVTSVRTDKQATGAADTSWRETECYKYDGLNRLKTAWSGTAQTCGSSAPAGGDLPAGHGFVQAWTFEDATNNRITDTYTTSEGSTKATYSYPTDGPAHAPGTVAVDTVTGTADAALTGIEGTYTYSDAGELLDRPVKGDVQRLEWDAEHHLASVDPAAATAADRAAVYDTAGARVLRQVTDPGAGTVATVYLPGGVELVHDSAKDTGAGLQSGEVTARRDYTFAGQLIATRTGVNPADVTTWSVDAQGTPEYALGNAEDAAATAQDESLPQRRQRPFGADRGTAPDKAAFPGEKGFVGSTRDEGVDLLQVGARPYDPVSGLFVTTDPIVDPSDPASLNAYAYAKQNPITNSDPTGLRPVDFAGNERPDLDSRVNQPKKQAPAPPPPTPAQPPGPVVTNDNGGIKQTTDQVSEIIGDRLGVDDWQVLDATDESYELNPSFTDNWYCYTPFPWDATTCTVKTAQTWAKVLLHGNLSDQEAVLAEMGMPTAQEMFVITLPLAAAGGGAGSQGVKTGLKTGLKGTAAKSADEGAQFGIQIGTKIEKQMVK